MNRDSVADGAEVAAGEVYCWAGGCGICAFCVCMCGLNGIFVFL